METFRRWIVCLRELAPGLLKKARQLLAEIKPSWKFEKDKRFFKADIADAKTALYQLFILRDHFTTIVSAKDYLPWLIFLKSTRFGADGNHLKRDNAPGPP